MLAAAVLPAPIALITVAAPVTASPPAKMPSRLVAAAVVRADAALLVRLQMIGGVKDQRVQLRYRWT